MIADLQKNPLFKKAMEEISKHHRPIVKNFNPSDPVSVDEWKYTSGLQDGFDLLYQILLGGKNG